MKKKPVFITLAAILVLMQFFQIDRSAPEQDPQLDFINNLNPPGEVVTLLKDACYDCHSYQTTYPWYTWVNPVGWWVKEHVNDGRKHLNFSEWQSYPVGRKDHKLEECQEEVAEGKMPMDSYTWAHASARLSQDQRNLLAQWFRGQRIITRKTEGAVRESGEEKLEHKEDR